MKKIHKILLFALLGLFFCGAKSDRYTPFEASGLPDHASKGFLWFSEPTGKIIRADMHGFTLREIIETIASMSRLEIVIEGCPETNVFLSITNDEPVAALQRLVKKHDLVLTGRPDGSYHIGPKAESEPTSQP